MEQEQNRVAEWAKTHEDVAASLPAPWTWGSLMLYDYARVVRMEIVNRDSKMALFEEYRQSCSDEEMDAALRTLIARVTEPAEASA